MTLQLANQRPRNWPITHLRCRKTASSSNFVSYLAQASSHKPSIYWLGVLVNSGFCIYFISQILFIKLFPLIGGKDDITGTEIFDKESERERWRWDSDLGLEVCRHGYWQILFNWSVALHPPHNCHHVPFSSTFNCYLKNLIHKGRNFISLVNQERTTS